MAARHVLTTLLVAGTVAGLSSIPSASAGTPGTVDFTTPAARDTDAVVLTGKDLLAGSPVTNGGAVWQVPENLTYDTPSKDLPCFVQNNSDPVPTNPDDLESNCGPEYYNHYEDPDADTSSATTNIEGTPTNRILGYRWDVVSGKFVQIPFQVDEVFTRYLNNDNSGFGVYSGTDKHTTYAYDREPFRYTVNSGKDGCIAAAKDGRVTTPDPVKGLDTNDELAFMAGDAGDQAPAGTALPAGVDGAKVVTIADPTNPGATPKFVYIMHSAKDGPKPAFDASNGYVRYDRDDNYDTLVYSRSSYGDYGPGIQGPYCTADGKPVFDNKGNRAIGPRKEMDTVTISTSRYRWRYDGRWLMTGVQIAQTKQDPWAKNAVYGPDLVDRWKARAFAQDPGSQTPCCGYEEEDTNWGGSSSLLGERLGPVRAIRETWGADSGTNVIRRETFYRDRMVQKNWLRVHVIPPLDGIYAQWDFNAGRMTKFFNSYNKDGVDVDGVNDEAYGNWDDPCEPRWDNVNGRTDTDETYRSTYRQAGLCDQEWFTDQEHASVDPGDLTFADANVALGWSQISGPWGGIVDRIHSSATDLTPGGAAQSVAAVPYYRDDSCFDDGTGADPGPELHPRNFNAEKNSVASNGAKRLCWKKSDGPTSKEKGDGDARGDDKYWQGDIGTHGLHILFLAESDNARTTIPVTEIVSDWDLVLLPPSQVNDKTGNPVNVGEQYGRELEKPLVAVVHDNF